MQKHQTAEIEAPCLAAEATTGQHDVVAAEGCMQQARCQRLRRPPPVLWSRKWGYHEVEPAFDGCLRLCSHVDSENVASYIERCLRLI